MKCRGKDMHILLMCEKKNNKITYIWVISFHHTK